MNILKLITLILLGCVSTVVLIGTCIGSFYYTVKFLAYSGLHFHSNLNALLLLVIIFFIGIICQNSFGLLSKKFLESDLFFRLQLT
jgi:hypothetical protein